jgi:hypothetical protein
MGRNDDKQKNMTFSKNIFIRVSGFHVQKMDIGWAGFDKIDQVLGQSNKVLPFRIFPSFISLLFLPVEYDSTIYISFFLKFSMIF